MKTKWPDKNSRQEYEIKGFVSAYEHLPHGRCLIVEERRDKPDYFVKDSISGGMFGVELTSEYLNDRSVPDAHMKSIKKYEEIPYDPEAIDHYKIRLIERIKDKIIKAKKYYDTRYPLILSVYVNEYISFHMHDNDWQDFVKSYEGIFDAVHPFTEVVFWSPANIEGDVFWVFSVQSSI